MEDTEHSQNNPIEYFAISKTRWLVCSILTGGLYGFYWIYRNFKAIKKSTKEKISPFWRAWLSIFWIIPLFNRIKSDLSHHKTTPLSFYTFSNLYLVLFYMSFSIPFMARMYNNSSFFEISSHVVSIIAIFVMLPIQNTLNNHNKVIDENSKLVKTFGMGEIIIILIGTVITILYLLETA
jgi:hypothetical protein